MPDFCPALTANTATSMGILERMKPTAARSTAYSSAQATVSSEPVVWSVALHIIGRVVWSGGAKG